MAVEIKVPSVGESVTEGRIIAWLKPEGSIVQIDDPLFELETDKASQPIPSPAAGQLKILVPVDSKVLIGEVVGSIETSVTAPTATPAPATPPPAASVPPAATRTAAPAEPILAPSARRIAEEKQIDPATIAGTGRGGRITKEDVASLPAKAVEAPKVNGTPAPVAAVAPPPAAGRENRQRMTAIRQRIAERLLQSQQTTASLTTFNEVDMTAIMDLRAKYKDKFKEKHGVNLGFMSFFVKAAVEALKAFPLVNARIDGTDIVFQNFYDIGVAVSTEKGLMVPVLRSADALNFAGIEKKIGEVAVKARDGKVSINDLQGGTFTITNGGIFGSMMSTPILNPPQSAILGMHSIQKRAMVVNDQIVIRPMMYLALTYDHRIIDGREAVQFLVKIKDCVEYPERILLEM